MALFKSGQVLSALGYRCESYVVGVSVRSDGTAVIVIVESIVYTGCTMVSSFDKLNDVLLSSKQDTQNPRKDASNSEHPENRRKKMNIDYY